MSLVDDGLVQMDKIGTSNYFWSFPSAAIQTKKNKLSELEAKLQKETERKTKLTQSIEESKSGREDSQERAELLQKLKEQQALSKELNQELKKYQDNDPVAYKEKVKSVAIAKEAANRWTENIWEIKSYCINNFGMEASLFDQQFGMKDDFDTLN